jgi:hypothetical protein
MEADKELLPEQKEALALAYAKIRAQFPAPRPLKVSELGEGKENLAQGYQQSAGPVGFPNPFRTR